jgi:hypothetical protein
MEQRQQTVWSLLDVQNPTACRHKEYMERV